MGRGPGRQRRPAVRGSPPALPCPACVPSADASPACTAAVEVETTSQASEPASQASDEEDAPATDIYFVSATGSLLSPGPRHICSQGPHTHDTHTPGQRHACHVHTLPHLHTLMLTQHTCLDRLHTRAHVCGHLQHAYKLLDAPTCTHLCTFTPVVQACTAAHRPGQAAPPRPGPGPASCVSGKQLESSSPQPPTAPGPGSLLLGQPQGRQDGCTRCKSPWVADVVWWGLPSGSRGPVAGRWASRCCARWLRTAALLQAGSADAGRGPGPASQSWGLPPTCISHQQAGWMSLEPG